ncbi:DUF4185 domain-containing protein [Sorangium sp. So ce1128]
MHPSDLGLLLATLCALSGCVIPLDEARDERGTPVLEGCLPFHGSPGLAALGGDGRSLAQGDGSVLWMFDTARTTDGEDIPNAALSAPEVLGADCGAKAASPPAPAFAPPRGDVILGALDGVALDTGPAFYVARYQVDPSAPLGLRLEGTGLARRDSMTGLFVPGETLLWSADRPGYGYSAVRSGDHVYTYGCRADGAFSAACFVARARVEDVGSTTGYTYFTGSGWSHNPDDAAQIAEAGSISVRFSASRRRWLMTHVQPLGRELLLRVAVAPEGPWSAPITLGACDLAGADESAFCGGAHQHPEAAPEGSLALTYGVHSFSPDSSAGAEAYWPRLTVLELPSQMP